jgi:hypothetical protein
MDVVDTVQVLLVAAARVEGRGRVEQVLDPQGQASSVVKAGDSNARQGVRVMKLASRTASATRRRR